MKRCLQHWAGILSLAVGCLSAYGGEAPAVRLIFAGDSVLDEAPGELIAQGGDPYERFAPLFAQADIRLTNLECVIATQGVVSEKLYTFRAHPRVMPILQRHFDAVTLANNHSGDYGPQAFAQMLMLLEQAGLSQVGGGMNLSQAHTPLIFKRQGVRIALLSYNEFHPRSFEATAKIPGVAWSEDEQVAADIQAAKRVHHADVVIPFMHWGWENETRANARQRQLARWMIDAGADAVIGGHPHVIQDLELYRGKPIVYSVGNFVMKQTDNELQRKAWLLQLEIDRKGIKRLSTYGVQIDPSGIPSPTPLITTPCWLRGDRHFNPKGQCSDRISAKTVTPWPPQ